MTRAELIGRLRAMRPWLASQGVERLRLFGSFARDEAREDSDVDLLVDFKRPTGLRFFTIERTLGEQLDRTVEFSTEASLHPLIRERVLDEAILV
jgi:predicted nucleotidyltransferase